MPNYGTYANRTQLKRAGWLDISSTSYDADLLRILQDASRFVDKFCDRWFYALSATRYYDGDSTLFLKDDLLSINASGLKTDEDGDGTYENTLAATDYHLYPLNDFPKTRIEINTNGNYGSFASGIKKGVEIAGLFGYGDGASATPYADSTTTTAEAVDIAETAIDVADGDALAVGQTILVESEQMYITGISSNTITVIKGVNGTTDAAHATGKTIYVYAYPGPIVEAVLIQCARWWRRRESAFADVVGNPETGTLMAYKGLDPDVQLMLKPYKRWSYP